MPNLSESQGLQKESNVAPPSCQRMITRKLKSQTSEVTLSGVVTICSNNLKHYSALHKNETTIAAHSFVYIQAVEDPNYLAYLEDIFENKRNTKCVKLRWFLLGREVEFKNPELNPHPREILLTTSVEVIRADCVTGPITVLTPNHYQRSLTVSSGIMSPGIYMCSRQLINSKIVPFSVDKLVGYSKQKIVSSLESLILSIRRPLHHKSIEEERKVLFDEKVRQPTNKKLKIKLSRNKGTVISSVEINQKIDSLCQDTVISSVETNQKIDSLCQDTVISSVETNQKIEVLCQDSGIQGCWFRCEVLQYHASKKLVLVEYLDLWTEDGLSKLKEWVRNPRVATLNAFQMRHDDRLTIRPFPPEGSLDCLIEVGTAVDVWWCDGWWECIVTRVDTYDPESVEVYFPGEREMRLIPIKDMRTSRDWVDNEWVSLKPKLDILDCIDFSTLNLKLPPVAVKRPRVEELKWPAIRERGIPKRRLPGPAIGKSNLSKSS